jgi:adenylate kinase family enzyme
MRRILVTGNAGAGKTSVAQLLAAQIGLPYVGLDGIVWRAGWVKTPAPERKEKEFAISESPTWVVDGVSLLILGAADTVIFLDYPRYTCFWRVLCRNIPYLFRSRPGLPERCPEISIVPTLVKIIWQFPQRVRPRILSECQITGKCTVHIRSNGELKQFLSSVGARPNNSFKPPLRGSA